MQVAILGGGINGVCCAVQILEHFKKYNHIVVTIIAEEFSPNTTGDGSAGLWGPYLLGGTAKSKVHKWSKGMHDFLEKLWLSEDAAEAGVCLIPVARLTTNDDPIEDFWKDIVYGCTKIAQKQLGEYNIGRSKKFKSGLHFITYTSEPIKLLPYLMKRFKEQGGKILKKKIDNFENFVCNANYDVIVNCCGLGARQMLADQSMFPVRGQVSRVKANWLYSALLDESDDGNYIIPNMTSVVLGGTHQEGNYDRNISAVDKKFIIDGCRKLVPGLINSEHLFDWVGLRPGRNALRLEVEKTAGKKADNNIIIHNYGHGGSGVTLAWGCAQEVLELLKNEIERSKFIKSKL